MIDLKAKSSQAEFGILVGISQPAVSNLLAAKIITAGADTGTWIREYCHNLRETAAGRLASGDVDLALERALLAREQKDRLAMQNAVTRKELAPVYLIEEVLAKAGAKAARLLDTIPGLVRRRVPDLSADVIHEISRVVAQARNLAAQVSLASLEEEPGQEDEAVQDLEGDL